MHSRHILIRFLFAELLMGIFLGGLTFPIQNTPNSLISPHLSALNSPLIVNHTATNYIRTNLIPAEIINQTKDTLHIAYQHTSHGSQLITGMTGLPSFKEANGGDSGLYDWSDGITESALDLDDYAMGGYASDAEDLGYSNWALATRLYLEDSAHFDVNVIIWSWCGQVGGYTNLDDMMSHYLSPMAQLEADFPNVFFIYMTGHTDGSGLTGDVHRANDLIRAYCMANNKILYDFEDIESYDPDGQYFGDKYVSDSCDYNGGNWAIEWQESHDEGTEWYQCSSAHSEPLNANLKAYAAWYLWARLAGWNPEEQGSTSTSTSSTGSTTTSATSNSESHATDDNEAVPPPFPTRTLIILAGVGFFSMAAVVVTIIWKNR